MSIKKEILFRIGVIYIVLIALCIGIVAKILTIQFVEGGRLRKKAQAITYRNVMVEPSRGDILATDGRVLATSIPYFEIRMDLAADGLTDKLFNENIDSLSICLSRFFGDRSRYAYRSELINARKYAKNKRYYPIAPRRVNYLELQTIKRFPLFRLGENRGGFITVPTNRRILPHSSLAARTIGKVNRNGVSVGIEGAYDSILRGKSGMKILQRIPGNSWVEVKRSNNIAPEEGIDIVTTIDVSLQDVAESALREHLGKHGADHGCAILMEVKTGEIKAIANLKRNSNGTYSEAFNYAIGEPTEPGSTIKAATLINLLEDGFVNLSDTINTGKGKVKIYDHTIQDSKIGGHGKLTVSEVFEVSSNVGVVKLVNRFYKGKEKRFVERLYRMKLNKPTGIEIPGEPNPMIKFPGDKYWSGVTLPMMSIGYELKLTPLQILTFYNAIANNGKMVKPHLVKAFYKHGTLIKQFKPHTVTSSICSKSTLEKVRGVLERVVEKGTAQNLKNPRYKIAGKTGTAQIARGRKGYRINGSVSYQASFVGYFPAESPKYSCIVVVNSPSQSVYYGNVVAGPVFKEISDKVYATSPEWFRRIDTINPVRELPESKAAGREWLTELFNTLNIPYREKGGKTPWVRTYRDSSYVYLSSVRTTPNLVPNVKGMGIKDAVFLIERCGMKVRFTGRGSVRSQNPRAGSRAVPGRTVLLTLTKTEE